MTRTTQKLPGTDAARHGTGDADLTIMLAAHDAFRRDLTRLARTAAAADLSDPAKRQSVAAGWELFKRELHLHHTAEDDLLWPPMRQALAGDSTGATLLDAMEAEHSAIDPLLVSIDAALADRESGPQRLGELTDTLAIALRGHLDHEGLADAGEECRYLRGADATPFEITRLRCGLPHSF